MPEVEAVAESMNVELVRAVRDGLPATHEWDPRELLLLALAERAAADLDLLEADIAENGVRSPSGRLSTVVSEARQARVALSRIVGGLDVPLSERPSVTHARRAALARWGRAG
jgi:hypothetical protein